MAGRPPSDEDGPVEFSTGPSISSRMPAGRPQALRFAFKVASSSLSCEGRVSPILANHIDQGDLGLPFRRVDLEGLGDLLDAHVETRGARRDSNP